MQRGAEVSKVPGRGDGNAAHVEEVAVERGLELAARCKAEESLKLREGYRSTTVHHVPQWPGHVVRHVTQLLGIVSGGLAGNNREDGVVHVG